MGAAVADRIESGWEHFPHAADIGVRGFGPTPDVAFAQAALALTAVVVDPATVAPTQRVIVACRAPDPDLLLVEWLNTVVFEMATGDQMFGRFAVRIDGPYLSGAMWGEAVDPARHQPAVEVKGATHAELRVERRPDGLCVAQCIVDV